MSIYWLDMFILMGFCMGRGIADKWIFSSKHFPWISHVNPC